MLALATDRTANDSEHDPCWGISPPKILTLKRHLLEFSNQKVQHGTYFAFLTLQLNLALLHTACPRKFSFSCFNNIYNEFAIHIISLNYIWPLNCTFGESKNTNMSCFKKAITFFFLFYNFGCKIRMSIKLLVSVIKHLHIRRSVMIGSTEHLLNPHCVTRCSFLKYSK